MCKAFLFLFWHVIVLYGFLAIRYSALRQPRYRPCDWPMSHVKTGWVHYFASYVVFFCVAYFRWDSDGFDPSFLVDCCTAVVWVLGPIRVCLCMWCLHVMRSLVQRQEFKSIRTYVLIRMRYLPCQLTIRFYSKKNALFTRQTKIAD